MDILISSLNYISLKYSNFKAINSFEEQNFSDSRISPRLGSKFSRSGVGHRDVVCTRMAVGLRLLGKYPRRRIL